MESIPFRSAMEALWPEVSHPVAKQFAEDLLLAWRQ